MAGTHEDVFMSKTIFLAALALGMALHSSQAWCDADIPIQNAKLFFTKHQKCALAMGFDFEGDDKVDANLICIFDGVQNAGTIREVDGCMAAQLDLLTGRYISLREEIDPTGGLKGSCSKQHIETMLQTSLKKFARASTDHTLLQEYEAVGHPAPLSGNWGLLAKPKKFPKFKIVTIYNAYGVSVDTGSPKPGRTLASTRNTPPPTKVTPRFRDDDVGRTIPGYDMTLSADEFKQKYPHDKCEPNTSEEGGVEIRTEVCGILKVSGSKIPVAVVEFYNSMPLRITVPLSKTETNMRGTVPIKKYLTQYDSVSSVPAKFVDENGACKITKPLSNTFLVVVTSDDPCDAPQGTTYQLEYLNSAVMASAKTGNAQVAVPAPVSAPQAETVTPTLKMTSQAAPVYCTRPQSSDPRCWSPTDLPSSPPQTHSNSAVSNSAPHSSNDSAQARMRKSKEDFIAQQEAQLQTTLAIMQQRIQITKDPALLERMKASMASYESTIRASIAKRREEIAKEFPQSNRSPASVSTPTKEDEVSAVGNGK